MNEHPYEPYMGDNTQADRPTDEPFDQPHDETDLSTADMAAAAEERNTDKEWGTKTETDTETKTTPTNTPTGDGMKTTAPTDMKKTDSRPAVLLPTDEAEKFRSRWDDIQAGFVDEPRKSVEQADALVAELMKRLAEVFSNERSNLEGQWGRGDQVSTEDLRVALQRYRSFFDRLLSV